MSGFECIVCTEDLLVGESKPYVTQCGHAFHYHCLCNWIERKKSCPLCRKDVTHRTISQLFLSHNSMGGASDDGDGDGDENGSGISHRKYNALRSQYDALQEDMAKMEEDATRRRSELAKIKNKRTKEKRERAQYDAQIQNLQRKNTEDRVLRVELEQKIKSLQEELDSGKARLLACDLLQLVDEGAGYRTILDNIGDGASSETWKSTLQSLVGRNKELKESNDKLRREIQDMKKKGRSEKSKFTFTSSGNVNGTSTRERVGSLPFKRRIQHPSASGSALSGLGKDHHSHIPGRRHVEKDMLTRWESKKQGHEGESVGQGEGEGDDSGVIDLTDSIINPGVGMGSASANATALSESKSESAVPNFIEGHGNVEHLSTTPSTSVNVNVGKAKARSIPLFSAGRKVARASFFGRSTAKENTNTMNHGPSSVIRNIKSSQGVGKHVISGVSSTGGVKVSKRAKFM